MYKYMQMRSRKQRQPGRRSRSRRSLKGGAPQAYKYEDVDLSVGNTLIQIAVTQDTQEDNETYSFNVPGVAPFNNYCDIVRYYQANVHLACVNPTLINSDGTHKMMPSLVQILGLALLLHNAKVRLQSRLITTPFTDKQMLTCMLALFFIVNSSDSLFTASQSGCIVSQPFKTKAANTLNEYEFFKVSGLSKYDVDSILKYFKLAMFYFKFNALPNQHLDMLTFNAILFDDPKSMATYFLDSTAFNKAIGSDPFKLYKRVFYTQENLSAPPVAAPVAPSAASAASLAPSPSSSVDVDARLAALETAVAEIQKSVEAIQSKLE